MSQYKTVAELLEAPERWTQGTYSKSESGDSVYPRNPAAVCWCLLGAIDEVYDVGDPRKKAYEAMQKTIDKCMLTMWNDAPERTHAEVLAAVRKAGI